MFIKDNINSHILLISLPAIEDLELIWIQFGYKH
jgi:hypothetical protein